MKEMMMSIVAKPLISLQFIALSGSATIMYRNVAHHQAHDLI